VDKIKKFKKEKLVRLDILDKIIDLKEIEILERENFVENYFKMKTLMELFEDERVKIIVAKAEEKIIGYISVYDNEDSLDIMKIAVKEDYKRKKIGTRLLNFVIDNFNKKIFLEVRESNLRAINFYTRYGFAKISIRKNYYKDNNENAIIMLCEKNNG